MTLIDTHIWIWWLNEIGPLTREEREFLDVSAERRDVAISAISLWEVQMLVEKKRLSLSFPFDQWIREASRPDVVQLCPIDTNVVIAAHELPKTFHGDPADRIIVATCIATKATLMSRDRKLVKFTR